MSTPSDLFPLGGFDHNVTKQNRSGHRYATAILVAYRHGLRASECRRGSLSHHGDQCEKVILLILSLLKIISGRSYDVIRTELAW